MAEVDILFVSGSTRAGKAFDTPGGTAGLVYMEQSLKALQQNDEEAKEDNDNWSNKRRCLKDLHTFYPVILKTREWAEANKKLGQIVTTQTDEEGRFSASLPMGKYGSVLI